MKQVTVTFQPCNKKLKVRPGITILEAAIQGAVAIDSVCGGAGTCKKCVVLLEPDSREVLACQTRIESDIVVTIYGQAIPQSSHLSEQQILQTGLTRQYDIHPAIRKIYLPGPTENIAQLTESLEKAISAHIKKISESLGAAFAGIDQKQGLTAVLSIDDEKKQSSRYKLLCTEEGDTSEKLFGVAVDIGTTTVVAKLFNLSDGRCMATAAKANPQTRFGDDVISRISHGSTQKGRAQLQCEIVGCLNDLISQMTEQANINRSDIYEIVAAGNTTMNHLLLNLPVEQLGRAPYKAFSTSSHNVKARGILLRINDYGRLYTIENIAGFVGSDTVAGTLAVGIDSADKTTLLVDIGTNGEIVLAAKGKLYAASCAAGPAFEGARISQGSRAVNGAIQHVSAGGDDITLDVIGKTDAKTICGSGLIDTVAVLLELGIIDGSGRFVEKSKLRGISKAIIDRLTEKDNQPCFILAHGKDRPVVLTQADIRQTQLAKAAIMAGVKLLEKRLGITDEDIEQVFLAGAFGSYINPQSALRMGLLPRIGIERILSVGNAAGSGAEMVLLSTRCRNMAASLAEKIEYLEIAHDCTFQDTFADCLQFGG